eukprot:CAMPEP_0119123014 /NCGR_PEP_ID=MMETSP1310-20130426/3090_1 /TAXON_ID=464262 /ORGANISM="Genus nov. species nov., Strain RCC2339" /LENGTH=1024 /DNA_ID=CAMNT_0007112751 /DNA_START=24 /DNA_END=3094 /DNA_ORIENTATION=-
MAEVPSGAKEAFAELVDSCNWTKDELEDRLSINFETGLTDAQVEAHRNKYGRNEFPEEDGTSLWMLILKQFEDTLVIILIVAAFISFVLAFFEDDEDERFTAFVEPLVIIIILVCNATVGVLQESSAEKAVEALKQYEVAEASVRRGGHVASLPAGELVVGDVVEVEVGQQVPADLRVVELRSSALAVDQALLTGESDNVSKHAGVVEGSGLQVQDKRNVLFSGSNVVRGKAIGVVVATGVFTEKGKIRQALGKQEEDEQPFPLQQRLDEFGNQLSMVIGVLCLLVWIINIRNFSDPAFDGVVRGAIYYFKIAISLAVAAIPEGLPAVVTTCLALGTQRMAKKNAIVRTLPAVETLGCTSVICSDKTGTLTTNQMSVQEFFTISAAGEVAQYHVEGIDYSPCHEDGSPLEIRRAGGSAAQPGELVQDLSVFQAMAVCSLCNEASISFKDGRFAAIGQSTEAAMRVLVEKVGAPGESVPGDMDRVERAMAYNRSYQKMLSKKHILEFSRDRKSMGVLVHNAGGAPGIADRALLVKGAWDNVLARCTHVSAGGKTVPLGGDLRSHIEEIVVDYCNGENAYRCLALAVRNDPDASDEEIRSAPSESFASYESNMTFVGVVAILDPPRKEVPDAIERCYGAGIDVIMITGDNMNTAEAICRKIGIFGRDESIDGKAFTGKQFKAMSQAERVDAVKDARLFSRVEPVDKQELVRALHRCGRIVAMTGDGVNDAPALKASDIGLAMGTGTAVAKGASDMILADDNFTTIVSAVEEGRSIYNNTKQFIRYLICSNIGEVVAIFITAIFGFPEVLLPVQLLWVNLVTDGLPAVALGFNPPEEGIMQDPPRPKNEPIVSGYTLVRYLITGTYIGLATVAGMVWHYTISENGPGLTWDEIFEWSECDDDVVDCSAFDNKASNTISLSILVTIEMFAALNSLSSRQSMLSKSGHPFNNPFLLGAIALSFSLHFVILYVPLFAKIFQIVPISWYEWQHVLLFSFPVIILEEIIKFVDRNFGREVVKVKRGNTRQKV